MTTELPSSIYDLFVATLARRGDAPALGAISAGTVEWTTWRELANLVEQRAAELRELGIVAGDRVVQYGANTREWIVNDLALHKLSAVHVPLHAAADAATKIRLIEHAQPRLVLDGGSIDSLRLRSNKVTSPAGLATLLYTSGTTGEPLGAMLSQQNLVANTLAVSTTAGGSGDELRLSILPFSHAYARTCDLYSWLFRGSRLVLSRGREHLLDDLQVVGPTAITGVPYLFEKIAGSAAGERIRAALGGNIKRCYSGGAALAAPVVEQFAEAGIPLLDGYGLTEASPVVAMSTIDDNATATVGRPLPNLEVKLSEDGEILVHGPSVMLGYWQDDAATRAAISDGWLRTGDLGKWDEAGRLVLVGRRKEMIALSTGMKVSPAMIEARLAASPWIEQVAVVGEGRSRLGALVVPNPDRLRGEIRARRLWVWSKRRAVTHPVVRSIFREVIDDCLSGMPSFNRPGEFRILTRGFSIDDGEMTVKLSLRRDVIARRFAKDIDAMYHHSRQQA